MYLSLFFPAVKERQQISLPLIVAGAYKASFCTESWHLHSTLVCNDWGLVVSLLDTRRRQGLSPNKPTTWVCAAALVLLFDELICQQFAENCMHIFWLIATWLGFYSIFSTWRILPCHSQSTWDLTAFSSAVLLHILRNWIQLVYKAALSYLIYSMHNDRLSWQYGTQPWITSGKLLWICSVFNFCNLSAKIYIKVIT